MNSKCLILIFLLLLGCSNNNSNTVPPLANPSSTMMSKTNCSSITNAQHAGTGITSSFSGTLRFEDLDHNNLGFTGEKTLKPIRFIDLELVRCIDASVLATGTSDAAGAYSISYINNSTAGLFLRVIARVTANTAIHQLGGISIKNNKSAQAIHTVVFNAVDDSLGSSLNINYIIKGDIDNQELKFAGGIFNIIDTVTNVFLKINGLQNKTIPDLTVFWDNGSSDGTFFTSNNNSIHLLGLKQDSDEYDDDVIAHEMGHFISVNFSRDDSPGGEHSLENAKVDLRLAWSEGFASFFSSTVSDNPTQLDTNSFGNSFFTIEVPTLSSTAIYTTNELAVSTVLWDLYDDTTTETFDNLTIGLQPIWDIITKDFPNSANISMEDFADAFFVNNPTLEGQFNAIAADRRMEFQLDSLEGDSTPETATAITVNGVSIHHNLYTKGTAPDKDYHKFTAVKDSVYTISTSALGNGADTEITLFASDGITRIATNDNADNRSYTNCISPGSCPPNDATTLASKIVYTAAADGNLFILITRSTKTPASAAYYGSYDISITTP